MRMKKALLKTRYQKQSHQKQGHQKQGYQKHLIRSHFTRVDKVQCTKFDAKAQKGIFLGYSERSKAYRLYNSETLCDEESMHVKFDDKEPGDKTPELDENFAGSEVSNEGEKNHKKGAGG